MMSRSVMDLIDVYLELCAGGILMKALELVKLPNYQSIDPLEFLYECLMSEVAQCCEPSFLGARGRSGLNSTQREAEDQRTATPVHPEHYVGAHCILWLDVVTAVEPHQDVAAGRMLHGKPSLLIYSEMSSEHLLEFALDLVFRQKFTIALPTAIERTLWAAY